MKTSTLPSVRVEPELREQLEKVLQDGETLSSFVETSVRESIHRRIEQTDFVKRGLASLDSTRRSGHYVTAESVVAKLQSRLDKARSTPGRARSAAKR
ncbi:MAG TPA: YlcI/YnfO family protein [Burkholderiaceae bacterium]|nr:YlcI/YnfO family protein [Burkholderiaceae bacterium]